MNPNRSEIFKLDGEYDLWVEHGPLPRGVLFSFSVNPYNGNVVLSWQDNATAIAVIERVLQQLRTWQHAKDAKPCRIVSFFPALPCKDVA